MSVAIIHDGDGLEDLHSDSLSTTAIHKVQSMNQKMKMLNHSQRKFVLVYIDDVIIFSRSLAEHLVHLGEALPLPEGSSITLSIAKCFFAYPSIRALGQHVHA